MQELSMIEVEQIAGGITINTITINTITINTISHAKGGHLSPLATLVPTINT